MLCGTVETGGPGEHCYMPNTVYPEVSTCVVGYLSKEQRVHVSWQNAIMTGGAAGTLNVILKALIDPGDEGITPVSGFERAIKKLC